MREQKTLSIDCKKAAAFFGSLFLCVAQPGPAADLGYDFVQAREAYARGDAQKLDAYAPDLKGTPLGPYVDYWRINMNLGGNDSAVELFLEQHEGSLLAEQLRKSWLKSLAKAGNWQTFYGQYPQVASPDIELECDWIQARSELGNQETMKEARSFWFSSKERPQSCDPLFNALIENKIITSKDIWARLRMILDTGDITLAREVNRMLPKSQMMQDRTLVYAYENPYRYLERRARFDSMAEKEIAIFAIMRVAKADPLQAKTFWSGFKGYFGKNDNNYVQARIAVQAALKHRPEALQWFDDAGTLDDSQLAWKARAAMREGNWNVVLSSIEAMSADAREEEIWRYWKARALKSLGRISESNAILAGLSHEKDYYGQLALEEMGTVMTLPPEPYKASDAEISEVAHLPGVERALLLYSLGSRLYATREWVWAIRGFDDRKLLAAAELARRRGLYDRAINTAEKTVKLNDFDLLFLAPYRDIMREQTRELGLDEAWVYGLIRQESRFVTEAKSGTGASGLMQLMPATAKWVASKLGLRNYQQALVNQVETNISLGTYYLKHVLTILDNQPVLASAAYNAGPARARQWVGPSPMEGAIYIETIPYGETRDYVKKVMSNTEYYASVFGQQPVPLRVRLGTVGGLSGAP